MNLSGSTLGRWRLTDTVLRGCDLANVKARGAAMTRVVAEGCRLTGAALTHATISDAAFTDCRLDLASFARTTLERVRFTRCTLEQADLGDATFSSVTFADCSLAGADLMDSQNVPLSRLIAFPRQPRIHSGVRYAIVVNLRMRHPVPTVLSGEGLQGTAIRAATCVSTMASGGSRKGMTFISGRM